MSTATTSSAVREADSAAQAPPDKREAILDAALALFSERTFEGTAVPLIAERAGVAAGTIYRYFADKEDLVNAVYQRAKTGMRDAILAEIPEGAAPRVAFHHIWRGLWRFAATQPDSFGFLETHHHQPYLNDASHAIAGEIDAAVTAFVRGAQAAGAMRDAPPQMLVAIVFGAFVGLVKSASPEPLAWDEDVIAESEACMWAAVGNGAPAQ